MIHKLEHTAIFSSMFKFIKVKSASLQY